MQKNHSTVDSKIYEVEGKSEVSKVTISSTYYVRKVYKVRVCAECSKIVDRNNKILANCILLLLIIGLILFTYFYFNVEKFWISDGFITTNISERTIWSYLGWLIPMALVMLIPISFVVLFARNFIITDNQITIDDALKYNAIVPYKSKNKGSS